MAAFKLLYSMTIMQVYNGDADAVSMLDELEFCYTKFLGDKETKTEDAGDASDALVEILLSFASKQSQLFRRMSEQVFGAFANQITENGLESLTSVCSLNFLADMHFLTRPRFSRPRRVLPDNKRCLKSKTTKARKKEKMTMRR